MSIKQTEGQVARQGGLSQGVTRSHTDMIKRRRELTDDLATGIAAEKLDDFAARMERMASAFNDDPFSDLEDSFQGEDAISDEVIPSDATEEEAQVESGSVLIGGLDEISEAADGDAAEDVDLSAVDETAYEEDDEDLIDETPIDLDAAEHAVDDIALDEEDVPADVAFEKTVAIEEDDLDMDGGLEPAEEDTLAQEDTTFSREQDEAISAREPSWSEDLLDVGSETHDEAVDDRGNISLSETAIADLLGLDEDDEQAAGVSVQAEPESADLEDPEDEVSFDETGHEAAMTEGEDEPLTFESVDDEIAERNAKISEEILEAQAVAEIEEAESELDESHLEGEDVDQSWGMVEEDQDHLLDEGQDPFDDVFGKPEADHFDMGQEDVDIGAKNVSPVTAPVDNPENFPAETVTDEETPVMMDSPSEKEVDDDMGQSALDKMLQARELRRSEKDYADQGDAIAPDLHEEADFPDTSGTGSFEGEYADFDEEGDLDDAAAKSPARGKLMRTVGIGAAALVVAGGVLVGAMSLTGGSSTPPSPVMPGINTVPTGKSNVASAPQVSTDAKTKLADAAPAAPKTAPATASDLAAQIPLPDKSSFTQPHGGGMEDVLAGLKQAGSGDLSDVTGAPVGGDYQAAIQKALVDYASAKDLAGLKEEMAAMKSSIATMSAAMSKKDEQIATLQKQVSDAKVEATNAKNLSLAQNDVMVKVVRMGEKVDTGEKLIVDLSKRVARLESVDPADKAEVKKRLDDLAQRLDGLNRDVALVARVAINGSTGDQMGGAGGATGANADPTSVYTSTKPAPKPPVDHGTVPSDVKKGDFVKGYGTVLDIMPTSGGSRLVVMENGSVLIK